MASGDLTASTPVKVDANDGTAIKTAIDALVLAAVTDEVKVVGPLGNNQIWIFKVERAA